MSIYSTVDFLRAEGERDSRTGGLAEGSARQLSKLLLRHGKRQFGAASEEQRALIVGLADRAEIASLESIRDRVLTAKSWTELLVGVPAFEVPAPVPPQPDYLLPLDFDPTPEEVNQALAHVMPLVRQQEDTRNLFFISTRE